MSKSQPSQEVTLLNRRTFFKSAAGFAATLLTRAPLAQAFYIGFWKKKVTSQAGTLWVWGMGSSGQLGLSNTANKSSPTQVGLLNNWADIAAGIVHSLAVKSDGSLWAWGTGTTGQLGDGTAANKSSPVQIGTNTMWDKITITGDHFLATKR